MPRSIRKAVLTSKPQLKVAFDPEMSAMTSAVNLGSGKSVFFPGVSPGDRERPPEAIPAVGETASWVQPALSRPDLPRGLSSCPFRTVFFGF